MVGGKNLFHKPEAFGTGKSVFTSPPIVFHSHNSKNAANVGPRKTHNSEFPWLVRILVLQPWVPRLYHMNPKILGRASRRLQRYVLFPTHIIPKMFQTPTHEKLRIMSFRGWRNLQCRHPRGDADMVLVMSATLFSFGLHLPNRKMHESHTQTHAPRHAHKLWKVMQSCSLEEIMHATLAPRPRHSHSDVARLILIRFAHLKSKSV